jgi:hypothetical protein
VRPLTSQTSNVLVVLARVAGQKVTAAREPCTEISPGNWKLRRMGELTVADDATLASGCANTSQPVPAADAESTHEPSSLDKHSVTGNPSSAAVLLAKCRADNSSLVVVPTPAARRKLPKLGAASATRIAAIDSATSNSSSVTPRDLPNPQRFSRTLHSRRCKRRRASRATGRTGRSVAIPISDPPRLPAKLPVGVESAPRFPAGATRIIAKIANYSGSGWPIRGE